LKSRDLDSLFPDVRHDSGALGLVGPFHCCCNGGMYYLFNGKSKEQFGPFSDAELESQIQAHADVNPETLFVWSSGWSNWKSLKDYRKDHPAAARGDDADIVREDSAIIRHIPKSDINRRKFTRFGFRLKCTIKSKSTLFETHSVDISLGGIQTEEPLPAKMLNEKCSVEIIGPDGVGRVKFTLNLAKREEPRYFFFSNFDPVEVQTLERWLSALSNTHIARPRLKA